jgi:hypothetical protein
MSSNTTEKAAGRVQAAQVSLTKHKKYKVSVNRKAKDFKWQKQVLQCVGGVLWRKRLLLA